MEIPLRPPWNFGLIQVPSFSLASGSPMTSIRLTFDVIRSQFDSDEPWAITCPGCQSCLEIHQPDEGLPARLLGTCPSCFAWYLVAAAASIMVRLPDEDDLRNA